MPGPGNLKRPECLARSGELVPGEHAPRRDEMSRAMLDMLKTTRPIIVRSSFGHTVLVNTRALELAKITASTPDPIGGKIWRDAAGQPTGLLEDAALGGFLKLLPETDRRGQYGRRDWPRIQALNRQGVTSFLDAVGPEEDIAAFLAARQAGKLTARAHFAPPIEPAEAGDPPRPWRE